MPRFTIVIPTRNRPSELSLTTAGLSQMRHSDFSVVISDNSDNGIAEDNRRTVEKNLDGLNFKYIRPASPMNMVDHWNFAVSSSEGDYIGIVTDRFTLIPSTLDIIEKVIEQTGAQCISYLHGTISPHRDVPAVELVNPISASIIHSREMLDSFALSIFNKRNPRFLNSFCSRGVISNITNTFGNIFGGIAPDYSFNFRFLSLHDLYVNIDAPLLLDHSPNSSNGMAISSNRDNNAARDFLKRMRDEQKELLEFGPIRHDYRILPNVILREMIICRSQKHVNNELPAEDPAAFYAACLRHIRRIGRFFDNETLVMEARVEEYRALHGLSRPDVKFLMNWQLKKARNTASFHFRHLMKRLSVKRLEKAERIQSETLIRSLASSAQEISIRVRGYERRHDHLDVV